MLLPEGPWRAAPGCAGLVRRSFLCAWWRAALAALMLLALAGNNPAQAAGGTVRLVRKYKPGQSMVYVAKVTTNSKMDSNPPELRNFFPSMPTDLRLNQQSTETVSQVHPDGAADVQHRFDKFDFQTDPEALPEGVRESVSQAQTELARQMVGKMLIAHYDHDGRLVDFDGADDLFGEVDASVREPLLQMLKFFLEQMGGQSLYPDHPVKQGDEWSQDLDAQPVKNYPFQVGGKSTLHYSGKTRYRGVKAAIVDYHFENTLIPAMAKLRSGGALPQLEAMGMHLDMQIAGKGQGRILVALDDGRVLQNHSSMHQTLTATLKGKEGFIAPADQLPRLEIQSDTEMEVEGSKP